MTPQNFISSSSKIPKLPLVFLVLTLLTSLGLFFYNSNVSKSISVSKFEKEKIEKSISDLKNKNNEIQIYNLLMENKSVILELDKRNKVIEYINHLKSISILYSIDFWGFSMRDWVISTSAISKSIDNQSIAYMKVVDFMKKYKIKEDALFDLWFIGSFQWMDTMKFNIEFTLK